MLYDEFLTGIATHDYKPCSSPAIEYAYQIINALYMADKLDSKEAAIIYYHRYIDRFSWLDELSIGHGHNAKKSDSLTARITDEEAKQLINREYCFELEHIQICGPAYYAATDWNHIPFMIKGYARIYSNGSLWDIYR